MTNKDLINYLYWALHATVLDMEKCGHPLGSQSTANRTLRIAKQNGAVFAALPKRKGDQ